MLVEPQSIPSRIGDRVVEMSGAIGRSSAICPAKTPAAARGTAAVPLGPKDVEIIEANRALPNKLLGKRG